MSLLVWLPMDGDLRNNGVSDVTITNNNATVNNNGKTGKCYSFNGTDSYLITNRPLFDNNTIEWSYACWVYLNSSKACCLFANRSGVVSTGIAVFLNIADDNLMYFDTGDRLTLQRATPTGQWIHLAFVFKKGDRKQIFINGILESDTVSNAAPTNANGTASVIGKSITGLDTKNIVDGKLCDVRIYDHALSAAEVHEISLGLVRHYKLDDAPPNYNILYDTNAPSLTKVNGQYDRYYESVGESDYVNTFIEIDDPPVPGIKYGLLNKKTETTGHFHSVTWYKSNNVGLNVGQTYTMSCYVKNPNGTSGLKLKFQYGTTSYVGHSVQIAEDTEWHQYSWSFTADGNERIYIGGLYQCIGEIIICGWKLERGTVATQWCPRREEPQFAMLYPAMVCDSSGFGHHGTVVGTNIMDSDTARYESACFMDNENSTNHIEADVLPSTVQSISMWVRGDMESKCFFADPSCMIGFGVGSAGGIIAGVTSNRSHYKFSDDNYTASEWNHIVVIFTSSAYKVYINGTEKSALSSKSYWTQDVAKLWLLNRSNNGNTDYGPNGSMSDFRAYVTVLSAADILNLYQTGAKIDNQDQLHGYSFKEETSSKIHKTGVVQGNITELFPNIHYDKNVYVEPDGSKWVHVVHHNDPNTNGVFNQTDDFAHGVYKNADVWYDLEQTVAQMTTYEFMVKQKTTSSATEAKYRWVQTVSPLTATYNDVKASEVTRITTTGYTDGGNGGFYGGSANTRTRIASSSSNNWYGAFGAWNMHSKGLPAYPPYYVTTGYMDLYLRIDNFPDLNVKISNNAVYAKQLIEM